MEFALCYGIFTFFLNLAECDKMTVIDIIALWQAIKGCSSS